MDRGDAMRTGGARRAALAVAGLTLLTIGAASGLGNGRESDRPHCVLPPPVLGPEGRAAGVPPVRVQGVSRALAPSIGNVHLLVILAQFPDRLARISASRFPPHLFGIGGLTMRQYFRDASGDLLDLTGDVYGWVTLPQGQAYYSGGTDGRGTGPYPLNGQKMTEDAVERAIAAGLDLGDYDADGDGEVDALLIVHSGQGYEWAAVPNATPEPDPLSINSHKWGVPNGDFGAGLPRVTDYFTCPELQLALPGVAPLWADSIATIGVYCHEFGHVLGLPDYYDTGIADVVSRVGRWDLMDGGIWNRLTGTAATALYGSLPSLFSGWSRMTLGWTAAEEVLPPAAPGADEVRSLTISSASTGAVPVQLGANPGGPDWNPGAPGTGEFFVAETRTRVGWDGGLPAEGLLIYHVDESRANNRSSDYPDGGGLIEVRPEDNTWSQPTGDPWPGSQTAFGPQSAPSSRLWSGGVSGVELADITSANDSTVLATATVTNLESEVPLPYAFPNPWRVDLHAGVGIRLALEAPVPEGTRIVIHDIRGRRVRALGEAELEPGRQVAMWDGLADDGTVVPAGVYFFRAGNGASGTGKVLLLR